MVSMLRGVDGCGILKADVRDKKRVDYKIYKGPVDYLTMYRWYMTHEKGDKTILDGINNTVFAGHNRAATVGKVTYQNTHPFKAGDIIGFHNGTLNSHRFRDEEKTDSELLIKEINEKGIKETLETLYKGNAYALVLLNKKTGRIHFARNEDRTLFFTFNANREVMYWASEEWMLRTILRRCGQSLLDNCVWSFEEEVVYTITPWDLRDYNKADKEFDCFEDATKYQYKYSTTTPIRYQQAPWETQNWSHWHHNDPVYRVGEKGVIYHKKCCGCDKELSLVEEFYAKKLAFNTYICDSCVDYEDNNNDNNRPAEEKEVHVG